MSAVSVDWETCSEDGCVGVRSDENGRCLAHLAPDERQTVLEEFAPQGRVDVRGVEISSELLQRLLDALPRTPRGEPRFKEADFRKATFTGEASFQLSTFDSEARFDGATFEGAAVFYEATFTAGAKFRTASFKGDAFFSDATFEGDVTFSDTIFEGTTATFSNATFKGDAVFDGAIFKLEGMRAWFTATFKKDAWFDEATFKGDAIFREATFEGDARFRSATFERDAMFTRAIFSGDAAFDRATFTGEAAFGRATFTGEAEFDWAAFKAYAVFDRATFTEEARFQRATFEALAEFDGATFEGDARFDGTTFERARQFGPVLVLGRLSLKEASFLQAADLGVSANRVSLAKATFLQGGRVRARWAEIVLDEADFAKPFTLAGAPRFGAGFFKERKLVRALKREGVRAQRSGRPRLVSLRRANVERLALSNVDLRACRFVGAANLDALRLHAPTIFPQAPGGFRATRRQTIAEEQEWRAKPSKRWWSLEGWYPTESAFPKWIGDAERLDPAQITIIYRELRKGREDTKNEPGAADFYYGEMEMRRHDRSASLAERAIIWSYWLVSGYGLRASRSLVSLVVTILVFAALFYGWGFPSHRSFLDAVTFSAERTTSLFRAPDRPLTLVGEWLQIGLRLLGPLFFGLALLSLRGRVKR